MTSPVFTAAAPVEAPVLSPQFTLPRVNLLPPEVRSARRLRRTQQVLAVVTAAVLVGLGGAYALARHEEGTADREVAATRAKTAQLQAAQARYADVPKVYAEVDALKSARAAAMASDVLWFDYLDRLAGTDPAAVWFDDLHASLFDTDTTPSDPLAPTGVGVLTVKGTGSAHPDLADWLDALDGTSGLASAGFTKSERTDVGGQVVVGFESSATVTPDALSHRYDAGND
jgi:Tfp pilus assembly protein PilN